MLRKLMYDGSRLMIFQLIAQYEVSKMRVSCIARSYQLDIYD